MIGCGYLGAVHAAAMASIDITDTLTVGVSGVGCTFTASASTQAAISFGAISPRLPPERKKEMAKLLMEQLIQQRSAIGDSGQPA